MNIISYGGGTQSTAMVVLAVLGRLGISVDAAVFANVGDDSEYPETLVYVRDVMTPWATERGLPLHEIRRVKRTGETETLYGRLTREGSRSLPIPIRMSNGAPGRRSCTADFKIRVIGKWLKANGASVESPAQVAIGISVDEIGRANSRRCEPHERIVYPLLNLGLRRTDCVRVIQSVGLPVPPKSACYFCPFHRISTWQAMRIEKPDLFEKSAELEDVLNERRRRLGKDPVYLTDRARPLREAVPDGVAFLPFADSDTDDGCDSGWCMT